MKTKNIIQNITNGVHEYSYQIKDKKNYTIVLAAFSVQKLDISLSVYLAAPGAVVSIVGIFLGGKSSDVHLHTLQVHQAPNTTSNLLVKTVLSDGATFNYDGRIRVEKLAQKTDAYQRNENLLIGVGSHATSDPSLEILANDVRCTHGSITGPIDPEELWYLESRGISLTSAKQLMVEGHFLSAVNLVSDSQIRDQLWQKIRSEI